MKKMIFAMMLAVLPMAATAAGGGVHLDQAPIDLTDKASLQRGAKLFTNYCLSCHSAKYMRYQRVAEDLGMTEEQVEKNLMFGGPDQKIGDTMKVAMPVAQSEKWLGVAPPDLSVVARARGTDWLYTYLRSFYLDDSRPFGVNNTVFPDVGMPHVLWELEGLKKPVYETTVGPDGEEKEVIEGFEYVTEGEMSPAEFDQAMADLTAFMEYMGEPVQLERQRLGVWVLLFLAVLFVLSYLLKKEYWKDIH